MAWICIMLVGVCTIGTAIADETNSNNDQEFKLSASEKALLELTNKERAKQGIPALTANEKLFKAARSHSANMARTGQLSHSLDGTGPGERLTSADYSNRGWGENCAAGQRTVEEALASWLSSAGHRANLLNSDYKEIGLGIVSDGRGGFYFTQVFGIPSN